MNLGLTDEQVDLRGTVRRFVADRAGVAGHVRPLLDDPRGTTDDVWRGLAAGGAAVLTLEGAAISGTRHLRKPKQATDTKTLTQTCAYRTFIACVAVFEIGSAICGAAPSSTVLIVGRGQHMVRKVVVQANRFLEVAGLNEEIAPIGTVACWVSIVSRCCFATWDDQ